MSRSIAAAVLTAVILSCGTAAQAADAAAGATAAPPSAAASLPAAATLPEGAIALPPAGAASAAPAASGADGVRSNRFRIRPVDDAWRKSLPRDADAATQAYLDRLPADVVASSNAYFEGGYWLILWNYLLGLVVSLVLLGGRRSARVRDWCQRVGRFAFVRDMLYGGFFVIVGAVLSLPLDIYQGYFREHQYEMATQTFGPWFVDQTIGLAVNTLIGAFATGVLYWIIRRARQRWAAWGAVGAIGLLAFVMMVSPVWIDPLFNTYKPVSDPVVKAAVLQMAKADGVPATDVYEFDESRRSTRVSANVAGLFGTVSVRLNDNLLKTSLPEIRAVMGHELGHYVLNHVYKMLPEFGLVFLVGFLFAKWAMDGLLAAYGARWGLAGVADVAGLPLFVAVFATFMFLATPVMNTLVRTQEREADRFGLNLAREPQGEAEAFLKLVEYRKASPGPLEEIIFFDHPSTRTRIHDAMQWREAMGTE